MDNTQVVIGIITTLLLNDPMPVDPTPEPEFVCEVPYIQPQPGFEVKGMCKGSGLRATLLNTTAYRHMSRDNKIAACAVIKNYLGCGFSTDSEASHCRQLTDSFNRYGIQANRIDC